MKGSMDLRSVVFAAMDGNQKHREPDGEGAQNTHEGQWPQGQEPNLPKGYRHIRDAIRALLTVDEVSRLASDE